MFLKFKGGEAREVCPVNRLSFPVEPDQVVEVDDDLGESLLTQADLWERAPAPRKKEA